MHTHPKLAFPSACGYVRNAVGHMVVDLVLLAISIADKRH